jgi:TnpA family transposase
MDTVAQFSKRPCHVAKAAKREIRVLACDVPSGHAARRSIFIAAAVARCGKRDCASDSKRCGAWDQNLLPEWHVRYGGPDVMIYWHVEKSAMYIYSQLKACSSSEVAARLEGVLRHRTDMEVEKNYVDTHGQSEVGFAFCHLLGFQLLPRLKHLKHQKLYRPGAGEEYHYANLQPINERTWMCYHQALP